MSLNPPSSLLPRSRRSVSLTWLVAVALVTAGVAVAATTAYFELRPAATAPPSTLGANRTTVVDDLGRTVTAPLNASRIVVLAPSIMDLVYRLGLRDRVVGIGCTVGIVGGIQNEYSPNQTSLWNLSPSICLTDSPSLDTEGVALLSPDLVLASTLTSVTDVTTLSRTYRLPVVMLAPATMDGIVGDVRVMAQLFPATEPVATVLEVAL